MKASPRDFIRDPVVLEFLGLPNAGKLQESEIEQALIEQLLASKYKLVLPSEEELRDALDRERAALEERLTNQQPR
jgi:adenylylsulfate kinase-like enzyme